MLNATIAARVAKLLIERGQTLAVSESSAGGLISASLLTVPGASAFYKGGGVIYTAVAGKVLLGLTKESVAGRRSTTVPMAEFLAETIRTRLGADWGLAETGAAGPTGNPYGDPAGYSCIAVAGPRAIGRALSTGKTDRTSNMFAFADSALALLAEALELA